MIITDRIIHESLSFKRLVQFAGDRTPFHAYLLVGSSMATLDIFARTFAAWLHCETKGTIACGTCKNCQLSRSKTHPAFHVVRPEGNELSIDAVRTIISSVDYKTSGGQHRVFAIEHADAMGEEAANAFLKTLEEPPPRTVFLLLTDRPDAIIATIASRCISTRVSLPAPEVIVEDVLPPGCIESRWMYLALLLTNSSLELIDRVAVGQSTPTPPTTASLSSLVDEFLDHMPPTLLLSSAEPFGADASYPIALFRWILNWLVGSSSPPSAVSALSMGLSFHEANQAIGKALKDHFKSAERIFATTYGKGQRDPSLDDSACRRRIRRMTTQHTILALDCLQVAMRLAVALRAVGSLPYHVEEGLPELHRLSLAPDRVLPEVRHVIVTCRKRLFANVTDKLIVLDLFSQLQQLFAGLPATPPASHHPEGGP